MAWGRKKSGGRREPWFGLAASLSELRLSPKDRVVAGEEVPRKQKRGDDDSADDAQGERKPRMNRSSRKRRSSRRRGGLSRLFYWATVLGLWAAIAVVGIMVWAGAHLPPIQSLEIPR